MHNFRICETIQIFKDRWVDKQNFFIHTMEYNSAIKRMKYKYIQQQQQQKQDTKDYIVQ